MLPEPVKQVIRTFYYGKPLPIAPIANGKVFTAKMMQDSGAKIPEQQAIINGIELMLNGVMGSMQDNMNMKGVTIAPGIPVQVNTATGTGSTTGPGEEIPKDMDAKMESSV